MSQPRYVQMVRFRADAVILEANVPNTITRTYFEQCKCRDLPY